MIKSTPKVEKKGKALKGEKSELTEYSMIILVFF